LLVEAGMNYAGDACLQYEAGLSNVGSIECTGRKHLTYPSFLLIQLGDLKYAVLIIDGIY
jgi:hypothetical protein